jgi:hypothetical protein
VIDVILPIWSKVAVKLPYGAVAEVRRSSARNSLAYLAILFALF